MLRYLAVEAAVGRSTASAPGPTAGPPVAPRRTHAHSDAGRRQPARWSLIAVELLIAIGAVAGGIGLIGDGAGIPDDWLTHGPFDSWVIPGVLLLVMVAAPVGTAAVAELRRWRTTYLWSLAGGALQVGWILGQWAVLRRYFFLQPVVLGCGLLVVALAWWVHGHRDARP